MVKVAKDGTSTDVVVVNSKVKHPNGQEEGKMMNMGDWYMAGYDLGHVGRHQMMVLFKTSDGGARLGRGYYPGR